MQPGTGAGGTLLTYVIGGAPESQADPDVGSAGTLRFPKYGLPDQRVLLSIAWTPTPRQVVAAPVEPTPTIQPALAGASGNMAPRF